jgi:hypothetical protein
MSLFSDFSREELFAAVRAIQSNLGDDVVEKLYSGEIYPTLDLYLELMKKIEEGRGVQNDT